MTTDGSYATQDYVSGVNGYWNTTDHVYTLQIASGLFVLTYGTTSKSVVMIMDSVVSVSEKVKAI